MIHYKIYSNVSEIPECWDALAKHDLFLQSAYLKALETASPTNIQLFYIGVFKNQNLVGISVAQRVQLYLKDMFRKTDVSCFKSLIKHVMASVLKGNILVLGNLTHTGQHGFYFDRKVLNDEVFITLMFSALDEISKVIKTNQNKTIRMIVLKDFFNENPIHKKTYSLNLAKLHRVSVQPNMILDVQPNWLSMEDYIACLHKKYRDRYKRARKKLNGIKAEELSLNEVETYGLKLHQLYLNVSSHAKFNTFILPENHFYSLKKQLGNNFKVFGYFLDDKLVGFYTLLLNNDALETYFLGYNSEHQNKNQLYLNMLYDMLKFGIENQFKTIVYARTAMEIKSSVGAEARAMIVYLKHTNRILNAILKQVFKLMNPSSNWEERHPFKDN